MSTFTAAGSFKNALYSAAVTLWSGDASVQVSYGHPGQSQAEDIVAVMDVRSTQDFATMTTNRTREEELRCTVMFSIFRPGGPDREKVCTDRAYALLGVLENYVRATDTTLGGVVRYCFLESHESDGSTDPSVLAGGRLIEISAVFAATNRITT